MIRTTDDGARRRDAAHSKLETCRGSIILAGRRALLTALVQGGPATADDVRDAVELPPDVDPVCLGAVPGALARAGIIERAGYVTTRRADAHARPVSVWRLVDRGKALQWLAEHPELHEPDSPPETKNAQRMLPLGGGWEGER